MSPLRALVLITAVSLLATACPKPGEGSTAEQAYRDFEPIPKALERYRVDSGDFPVSLDQLVPRYLGVIPTTAGHPPGYRKPANGGYELSFSYTGPGMNHCAYTPAHLWQCSGYY